MTSSIRRDELARRLRQRVLAQQQLGLLKPGDQLPGARELAREFDTDPRVVLAAFRDLQRDSLVELRNRSGVYVASEKSSHSERSIDSEWMAAMLAEALRRGVPAPEFSSEITRALETLRLRVVVVDCNDDQLFSMREELKRDYGFDASAVKLFDVGGGRLPLPLRNANLLVTTTPHADAVARIAKRAGCPSMSLSVNEELIAETRRLLDLGPVYFVVTDPVLAEKLRYELAESGSTDHMHLFVFGRDDVATIPEGAAVYVTPLARQRLQESGAIDINFSLRAPDAERTFSASSSMGLLQFITQANLAASE